MKTILSSLFLLLFLLCLSVYCFAQVPQIDVVGVAGEDGIRLTGGEKGIQISSTIANGINMNAIGSTGLNIFGTGGSGIQVIQSGSDGMYIFNTADHGLSISTTTKDGIFISDAGWRAGYFSNSASSTYPAVEIAAGNDANIDLKYSGHGRIESDGGVAYYLDVNNNSTDRFSVRNSALEDVFYISENGNALIKNNLSIPSASGTGIDINNAGNDGISIVNPGDNGINIWDAFDDAIVIQDPGDSGINVFNAGGHAGYFQSAATSPEPAVEIRSGDDAKLDLRLDGHGKIASGGDVEIYLDDNNNGSNAFKVKRNPGGVNGSDVLIVNESGLVQASVLGLGFDWTTPIGYVLSVDGSMIAEEVVVEMSQNWPDYVFAQGHNRLSISSLENYINEHHHLPGIPSAKEIEEDGLNLGEMQRLQMEKIEELTLYIIELQKEIDQLKNARK